MLAIPQRPLAPLLVAALAAALPAGPSAQESKAVFDAAVPYLSYWDAPFRRLLDIDADGDLDAVGLKLARGGRAFWAALYENDGQGAFTEIWDGYSVDLGSTGNTVLIEAGDLDADEEGEFVVSGLDTLYVYDRHYSAGVFIEWRATLVQAPGVVEALAVGDVDGDGVADVVLATDTWLEVRHSDGTVLTFAHGLTTPPATTLRIFDADANGRADLLLATPGELHFFHQNTPGAFTAGPSFYHAFAKGLVDTGDVDGDDDADVVVFDDVSMNRYQVLRCLGVGSWSLESVAYGGPGEFLYDVDGDGDLDGVCCGGGPCYTCPQWEENIHPTEFQVSLNDGHGNFAPAFQIDGLGSPQLAGVADLDADGDVDLIAGRVVYYSRGGIAPPKNPGATPLPFVPRPREIADFDGDGDPDVGLELGRVFVNDGNGAFQQAVPWTPPAPPGTAFRGPGYTGDFDGDGDVDLLVEHRLVRRFHPVQGLGHDNAPSTVLGMRILRNDGYGAFLDGGRASGPGITFSMGSLKNDASLATDLNADGALDLVTRSMSFPASSALWLNKGSGSFVGPYPLTGYRVEHVEDLDLDGLVELVTSDPWPMGFAGYQKLEVFHGSLYPNGLPAWTWIPGLTGNNPPSGWIFLTLQSPAAYGDMDAAGFTDIVMVRFGTPVVLWDRQSIGQSGYSGKAAFRSGRSFTNDAYATVGDLNDDGLDDVVLGPWDSDGKEVVPMFEVDSMVAPWTFDALLQLGEQGALCDVDLDGDLDLIGREVTFNAQAP